MSFLSNCGLSRQATIYNAKRDSITLPQIDKKERKRKDFIRKHFQICKKKSRIQQQRSAAHHSPIKLLSILVFRPISLYKKKLNFLKRFSKYQCNILMLSFFSKVPRAASCKKSIRKNKSKRKNKSTRTEFLGIKIQFLSTYFFFLTYFFLLIFYMKRPIMYTTQML